jgi:hypothetical protein
MENDMTKRDVTFWLEQLQGENSDDIKLAEELLCDLKHYCSAGGDEHDDIATLINLFTALRIDQLAKTPA